MLTAADYPVPGRRRVLDPNPRFRAERTKQAHVIDGWLDQQIGKKHLVRQVTKLVGQLDMSAVVSEYSSLGRRGYHPRDVAAVLIYASLQRVHESTRIAALIETDAAFRFAAGGHRISSRTLRRFREKHEAFFQSALDQSVRIAGERGLLDPAAVSVDSVRLRANASTSAVRTLKRSRERLEELGKVDPTTLSEAERLQHQAKVAKHQEAIANCEAKEASSVVTTNPLAGLMKFPSGAGLPGHRVTVAASGKKHRIVVGVLIDGSSCDVGKLPEVMKKTRETLGKAGVSEKTPLRVRADAGYFNRENLRYALENRDEVDVLIVESTAAKKEAKEARLFGRERFKLIDGKRVCPAGTPMNGPYSDRQRERWDGVGCASCPSKTQCTTGKKKSLLIDHEWDELANAMRERMSKPDAPGLYAERIATIEPVFASVQEGMGYRRVTSRLASTIRSEILLKLLAHNFSRLIAARPLFFVFLVLSTED